MAAFEFYMMSEEDQVALRDDLRQSVALLCPCKSLADQLASSGGIFAPLNADDERLLQGFHLVAQAYEGYQREGAFDRLCQEAGLWHSDVGLLAGRVQTLFAEREPVRFEAESYAVIYQWLQRQGRGQDQEEEDRTQN